MAAKRNITLDKFIEILTKIRDERNIGDWQVSTLNHRERKEYYESYTVKLKKSDIRIDEKDKEIYIDSKFLPL